MPDQHGIHQRAQPVEVGEPGGPLMYLECPVTVAIRPSIDCPIWPTTTRSSTLPGAAGRTGLSQGWGRGPEEVRKLLGTWNHCESVAAGVIRLDLMRHVFAAGFTSNGKMRARNTMFFGD